MAREPMSKRTWQQAGVLTLVLFVGLGIGLGASLLIWPVTCVDASPIDLTDGAECRWAEVAAIAYGYDLDLAKARARMRLLRDEADDALCAVISGKCPSCTADGVLASQVLLESLALTCGGD